MTSATTREVIAQATDDHGEVVLARRGEIVELVVDGVFAMDTVHTATEQALARLALDRLGPDRLSPDRLSPDRLAPDRLAPDRPSPSTPEGFSVLVGGLGLGFTCATVLADPRVAHVHVVELHPALVEWSRQGLIPSSRGLFADPRLTVRVGDVLDVVPQLPRGTLDAVLLDVDNGPGFLTHPGNTAVYGPPFLVATARALRRGGILGVWSADAAPELAIALERACGQCDEVLLQVTRDGRTFTYAVYLARVVR